MSGTESQRDPVLPSEPKKVRVVTETPVMPKIVTVPDSDTLPAVPTLRQPRENPATTERARD